MLGLENRKWIYIQWSQMRTMSDMGGAKGQGRGDSGMVMELEELQVSLYGHKQSGH